MFNQEHKLRREKINFDLRSAELDFHAYSRPEAEPLHFERVTPNSTWWPLVRATFRGPIKNVYGDQTSALQKIEEGDDRVCEIMFKYDNPVGLLVYKNHIVSEHGISEAAELKTLYVLNPEMNTRMGIGSKLFQRMDAVALQLGAKACFCTASPAVSNSIDCAVKNGYEVVSENEGSLVLCKKLKMQN